MALERPELFAAYVGTRQVASWNDALDWQLRFVVQRARAAHDTELLATLEALGRPDPTEPQQFLAVARPLRRYLADADAAWLTYIVERTRASPLVDAATFEAIGDGMGFSGRTLFATQTQERLSTTALHFALPYYVIQGRHDLFTPTPLAKAYFDRVTAPRKSYTEIEDAGHFALVTHAADVLCALRSFAQ
jgi:pimeloyl-ACP methyl ester carboxylesterase